MAEITAAVLVYAVVVGAVVMAVAVSRQEQREAYRRDLKRRGCLCPLGLDDIHELWCPLR